MTHILDDQNIISQRDPQGALVFAAKQPEQLAHDFGIATGSPYKDPVRNVVFAGMGGSSLVAEFARTWPAIEVPFVICKEYRLPAFVGKDTLVICASYSGNTEETLEALNAAEAKGAQIAIIAHGGKLASRAKDAGYLLAELPEAPQPRTGVFAAYRALVEILVVARLVQPGMVSELAALVDSLKAVTALWAASVPTEQNYAKQLAGQMVGKTPIIYGGPLMYPAAYKWKISVNENAKNTAWCNFLPEFNHNEFIGWSSHPIEKPFAVIDLISRYEHPRVLKRFELVDRLLSGMRPKSINVQAEGAGVLEHLLYLVLLGDYATTYMALLNGVNPTPVDLVEKFKRELGPNEPVVPKPS
jgi:glucose/mannose-6-phosphate isomerase